ncbi:MAG: DUF992 domain-containing protein [Pseudomonadota bacterium]
MKNSLFIAAGAAIVGLVTGFGAANATGAKRTQLGALSCDVSGGIGLIVGSSKTVDCTFTNADGSVDTYTGKLNKFGLDVGISGESVMKWVVFTPVGNEIGDKALAGKYGGVSAGASLGIGLGANALVGGSGKKIGLQPISIEGKTGLNAAIGVAELTLDAS